MRRTVLAATVLAATLALAGPVHAARVTLGTHLGITHYAPDRGDGLTLLQWPTHSQVLVPVWAPGLRVGVSLDAARRQQLVFDTSLDHLSASGESYTAFQLMGAWQLHFGAGRTQPFVNLGAGVFHIGGEDDAWNPLVVGGGAGVRHTLAREQGAVRAEVRVDHQFEVEESGFPVLQSLDGIGLRLGFDLFLD